VVIAEFFTQLLDNFRSVTHVGPLEQRFLFSPDFRLQLVRGIPVAAALVVDVLNPGPPDNSVIDNSFSPSLLVFSIVPPFLSSASQYLRVRGCNRKRSIVGLCGRLTPWAVRPPD